MIKAVKKLNKLWSRKKKRKRLHHYQQPYYYIPPPPPPPPCYLCCSYTTAAQPSAPPLPPWLLPEQTNEENLENAFHDHLVYPSQGSQEIAEETSSTGPTLPGNASSEYSHQQYMEPNPVYGVPVVEVRRRERSAGFLDRLVKFAAGLIGCVCPCFQIRDGNESVM